MAMTTIELLQAKLSGTAEGENTALLQAYIEDATALAIGIVYPFGQSETLPDNAFYRSWVSRAALEMISKIGAEGQMSHGENGINRSYSGGTVSKELLAELTPKGKVMKF